MNDYVMVTNWEIVPEDDFYLSDEWIKAISGNGQKLRKQAKNGNLFYAYIVLAKDYCIYHQMDALQIIIDEESNEIITCENVVIGNEHETVQEYSY